jgi:hypothetical protein
VIEALSEAKIRDKRLINDYTSEEIVVRKVPTGNSTKQCRCFTTQGISRYVHEGRIYSYRNVCEYFALEPRDRIEEDFWKHMVLGDSVTIDEKTNEFTPTAQTVIQKKEFLRWIFDKRKLLSAMPDELTLEEAARFIEKYPDINEEKRDWFILYVKEIA